MRNPYSVIHFFDKECAIGGRIKFYNLKLNDAMQRNYRIRTRKVLDDLDPKLLNFRISVYSQEIYGPRVFYLNVTYRGIQVTVCDSTPVQDLGFDEKYQLTLDILKFIISHIQKNGPNDSFGSKIDDKFNRQFDEFFAMVYRRSYVPVYTGKKGLLAWYETHNFQKGLNLYIGTDGVYSVQKQKIYKAFNAVHPLFASLGLIQHEDFSGKKFFHFRKKEHHTGKKLSGIKVIYETE